MLAVALRSPAATRFVHAGVLHLGRRHPGRLVALDQEEAPAMGCGDETDRRRRAEMSERCNLRERARAVGLCGDCAFPPGPCICGFDLPHYKTTKSRRERIET